MGIMWMSRQSSKPSPSYNPSTSSGNVKVTDPCKNYDCGKASKKLENIEKEIKDRQTDLRNDVNDLAAKGMGSAKPGLPPSQTVEGHYDLLDYHKANYAKWQAEYVACCGAEWRDPFKGKQGPEQ
jgi:hypothetical protein